MKLYCMCQITGDVPARAHDSQGFGPVDGQCHMAPNRFGVFEDAEGNTKEYAKDAHGEPTRPVLLDDAMMQIVTGVPQEVRSDGEKPPRNQWNHVDKLEGKQLSDEELQILKEARQHFPNVDLFKCANCGALIVRDG